MKSPTQRKIAALKPLEKRYSVALGYGLSLKVQPSGAKSFVLRLCLSGRVTDILLGHFPEMSLGEAKQAARRRRKEIGEACLSHVSGSQVSRAYLRSDYLKDRVSVMWRWCSFILACAREGGLLFGVLSKIAS